MQARVVINADWLGAPEEYTGDIDVSAKDIIIASATVDWVLLSAYIGDSGKLYLDIEPKDKEQS